jgi:hypothetical protein
MHWSLGRAPVGSPDVALGESPLDGRCLLGIAAWVGVAVLAGALADDPTDPKPTLIAFAAGGTAFFGAIFGYSLWRTRRRPEPELDALLGELSVEPGGRPRRP